MSVRAPLFRRVVPILWPLALAAAPGAFGQDCAAPPPGLLYWMPAEGTLEDQAGARDGTATGTGTGAGPQFATGAAGQGLAFDGIDDGVVLPGTAEDIAAMRSIRNNFSYEVWARPTGVTPSCLQAQSNNCSGIAQRFALFPQHGDTGAEPGDEAAGVGLAIGTNAICVAEHGFFHLNCLARFEPAQPFDDWIHIVVVMQDRLPSIYVNGALAQTGVRSIKQFNFASLTAVGTGFSLGSYAGDLDEFSVYSRALDATEVQALFAAGSAGKCGAGCATLDFGTLQYRNSLYTADESPAVRRVSVERVGGTCGDVSVDFSATTASASAGADFTAVTGTLTWSDGEASVRRFNLPILGDEIDEDAELVALGLANPVGGASAGPGAQFRILDDDPEPVISISGPATAPEGQIDVEFTLTLDRPKGRDITVILELGGSATRDVDYQFRAPRIVIPAGTTSLTRDLRDHARDILDDSENDDGETIVLAIDRAGGAVISPTAGSLAITILDND